jgi:hypothetical protein
MLQLNLDAHSTPTQQRSAPTVAQHWHAFGFHYISLASISQDGLILTNQMKMALSGTWKQVGNKKLSMGLLVKYVTFWVH